MNRCAHSVGYIESEAGHHPRSQALPLHPVPITLTNHLGTVAEAGDGEEGHDLKRGALGGGLCEEVGRK
jgi:hypothetical protein